VRRDVYILIIMYVFALVHSLSKLKHNNGRDVLYPFTTKSMIVLINY
jgi:hypothetical protein